MRRTLRLILLSFTVWGYGCASTDITGFRDPAFKDASYNDVVVMARSGDLMWEKSTETRFVECLSKRKIHARPSTDIFPPTRQIEAQEILKKLSEEGVGALLFVGLNKKWEDTAFHEGTSYSEPREKSSVRLIDAKTGAVAWTASTFSAAHIIWGDDTMISSLASKTTAALMKEGLLRPAQDRRESNAGVLGEAQAAVVSSEPALDQQAIIAYLQFASAQSSDPNRRVARLVGYLDAHYPYEKTAGVLAAADLLASNSTVAMTGEQAACWIDDGYRRQSNGEPISDPGVFLARYASDAARLHQATPAAKPNRCDAMQLNRDTLVRYQRFAKRQHTDPNVIYARILGYLDAHYPYQVTVNATETLELLLESSDADPTPEDAVYYLNECYRWLCGLPVEEQQKRTLIDIEMPSRRMAPNRPGSQSNAPAPGVHRNQYGQSVARPSDPIVPSRSGLQPNAYGLGVHQNQFGQPVTVRPDYGGVPGEQLQIKQNVYGPGIHMDQYGRPVREYSWPDGKPIQ